MFTASCQMSRASRADPLLAATGPVSDRKSPMPEVRVYSYQPRQHLTIQRIIPSTALTDQTHIACVRYDGQRIGNLHLRVQKHPGRR